MRGNEFLDKMGLIAPAYVEAADAKMNKKKSSWIKWGTIAACFAVMILAGTMLLTQDESGLNTDLPMLSISENTSAAMGYEGYMAYDISELVNANPWNEQIELTTLPVYKNTVELEEFIPKNYDKEKVLEKIRPYIQRDGGDVVLDHIENNIVYVRFLGACVGCMAIEDTFYGGIRDLLLEEIPELEDVRMIDVNNTAAFD